jgi:lipopolysaccharide/colanic/teichoic acid biosynthesis glycosyltransferase/NDP-sugar pyrophosphorylase family protein
MVPKIAVILAGSAAHLDGISLGAYPKIFLPIANRPLLDYLASVLNQAGVKHLVIMADNGLSQCRELPKSFPLTVEWVAQESPRGTGGSLQEVQDRLSEGPFWVMSSNIFINTDIHEMFVLHLESGAIATTGAIRLHNNPWEMERIESDANGYVKTIHRMHPAQEKRSMLLPLGLYLFEPEIFKLIPPEGYFDLKEQLFSLLYEHSLPSAIWEAQGYYRLINNVTDYLEVNADVVRGRVYFPDLPVDHDSYPGGVSHAQMAETATTIDPVLFGVDTSIGDQAVVVGPSIIGDRCQIGPRTILNECILLQDACIGQGVYLDRCIIGEGVTIANSTHLHQKIVLPKSPGVTDQTIFDVEKKFSLGPTSFTRPSPGFTRKQRFYLVIKRILDIILATVGLIVSLPLTALIALAIKLDTPGDVIFLQRRCGKAGHEFAMYKFRSMLSNAEELKREVEVLNEVDGPMFKITVDPRVTRVGRWLRRTNLDELPQLWNVLKGNMSFIGPRPLSMDEMRFSPSWRDIRLTVRPGLTGLWQSKAHTQTSFADWIRYDTHYVRHLSAWLDLKIVFGTIIRVTREGLGLQ